MRPKRDQGFLYAAVLAAVGGVLAIAASIGAPLILWLHGGKFQPAFFIFSAWGMFALCGAAANIYTYFLSGPPPGKPPRGGQRVATLRVIEGTKPRETPSSTQKAA